MMRVHISHFCRSSSFNSGSLFSIFRFSRAVFDFFQDVIVSQGAGDFLFLVVEQAKLSFFLFVIGIFAAGFQLDDAAVYVVSAFFVKGAVFLTDINQLVDKRVVGVELQGHVYSRAVGGRQQSVVGSADF